jgi:Tol biopolymer transport system component
MSARRQRLALVFAATALGASLAPRQSVTQELLTKKTRIAGPDSLSVAPKVAISPDGRWLVFSADDNPTQASLWIVPASGGRPNRLTDAGFFDFSPVFFPSGDRILFHSTRPAKTTKEGTYLMALPFDGGTGKASGAPKQLTFEPAFTAAVSFDGTSIAYTTMSESAFAVKVMPAKGGNARVLMTTNNRLRGLIGWSRDGASVLVQHRGEKAAFGIYRIPASGGTPVMMFESGKSARAISSDGTLFALVQQGGTNGRGHSIDVVDRSGRIVFQHDVRGDVFPAGFGANNDALYLVAQDVSAQMRVRGVNDDTMRDLSSGRDYPWGVDWMPDSKALAYFDDKGLLIAPLGGDSRRVFTAQGREAVDGSTATHALVAVPTPAAIFRVALSLVDLKTGARSVLTRTGLRTDVTTAGGDYATVGNGFFYMEERGTQAALMLVRPGETPRTLRTMTFADAIRHAYTIHGSRTAFTKELGDSIGLFIADGPTAAGRLITTIGPSAAPGCCRANLAFSRDGTWLVTSLYGKGREKDLLFIEVPSQGRATHIRAVQVPADYWYEPRWLPDNRGVTVIGGVVNDAHIFFMPLRESEKPINITRNDSGATWGHVLSPDGRFVAYAAEIRRGSAIWKVDLPKR